MKKITFFMLLSMLIVCSFAQQINKDWQKIMPASYVNQVKVVGDSIFSISSMDDTILFQISVDSNILSSLVFDNTDSLGSIWQFEIIPQQGIVFLTEGGAKFLPKGSTNFVYMPFPQGYYGGNVQYMPENVFYTDTTILLTGHATKDSLGTHYYQSRIRSYSLSGALKWSINVTDYQEPYGVTFMSDNSIGTILLSAQGILSEYLTDMNTSVTINKSNCVWGVSTTYSYIRAAHQSQSSLHIILEGNWPYMYYIKKPINDTAGIYLSTTQWSFDVSKIRMSLDEYIGWLWPNSEDPYILIGDGRIAKMSWGIPTTQVISQGDTSRGSPKFSLMGDKIVAAYTNFSKDSLHKVVFKIYDENLNFLQENQQDPIAPTHHIWANNLISCNDTSFLVYGTAMDYGWSNTRGYISKWSYKESTIGIESIPQITWYIYPNPATDKVLFSQIVDHAELIDQYGKTIAIFTAVNEINVGNILPGIYFVKITTTKEGFFIKKILII